MKEQQAQELWNKNLRELNGVMRLDSTIIKTILEAANINSQPPVMQKQTDTDLLKTFMKNHNCRLSYQNKWLVKDDATAVWHVCQQEHHKKVKQILITEDLQEALSLLST